MYYEQYSSNQVLSKVGYHEANIVLKDNDLRTKINLTATDCQQVLDMLKKDSELLGELGVLDYRYLINHFHLPLHASCILMSAV